MDTNSLHMLLDVVICILLAIANFFRVEGTPKDEKGKHMALRVHKISLPTPMGSYLLF